MHPLVRDLYKRIVFVGREYPLGLTYVRNKAKEAFLSESKKDHELSEKEILRLVNRGRYMVKEMEGVIQFKKYRFLRRTYGSNNVTGQTEESLEKTLDAMMKEGKDSV
jgi:predicted  nucleic acid-binding Zn ribbon protein